jgi:hypothetical protein
MLRLFLEVMKRVIMLGLAQNVPGIQVRDSGYCIPEERPDFLIKMPD